VVSNDLLRRDVRMLGDMLGEVIADLAGPASLDLVESIRLLSRDRRSGSTEAERLLADKIAALDVDSARTVARAFGIFFDLANIAEDRQRVRVLREREQQRYPKPVSESLVAAIAELKAQGLSADEAQAALERLSIELVFTAHPSEAKRRAIRAKLRRMRHALQDLDRTDLLPRERERCEADLKAELVVLWQTEFLRPVKPTVLDEVERGLSIMPRLWEVVPQVYDTLRRGLAEHYPDHKFTVPTFLQFGSWMGGDRDGNPFVTADVTIQTLCRMRNAAIELHLAWCKKLYDYLTVSLHASPGSQQLLDRIEPLRAKWPELGAAVEAAAPHEAYRRWLRAIQWRLRQSQAANLDAAPLPGDYGDGTEFEADVAAICTSLLADRDTLVAANEAGRWLDLTRAFGLRLTRLDIRQDARRYAEVLSDILAAAGVCVDFVNMDDAARAKVLVQSLGSVGEVPLEKLQPLSQDTLKLYTALQRAVVRFGPDCLGGNVVSLTRSPADLLGVLWLWRWAQQRAEARGEPLARTDLRIVPLFEKIGDLQRAPQTLATMLDEPVYAEYLKRQGNRQMIMVGYSDSTKDGGYLSACWGLQQGQSGLHEAAAARGVKLTFFHGRGGSLGRGGGPAARGILSLPSNSLDGSLRLTEQGEVLAERYDDVQIAFRHLEQVTWATLTASTVRRTTPKSEWLTLTDSLAATSLKAYRELVDQPGFIAFFGQTTPIDEIENLPIGSRPARRRGERSLDDLRAIPWVFSWTQNRCIIPAWYGLGTALTDVKYNDRRGWQTVREMYREWPFFAATIDNAVLALAKADMWVAQRYSELAEDDEVRKRIWQRIAAECDRSRQAVLDVVGEKELLGSTPWFQSSIEARNPYIDPLNLIQIEFMRRRRMRPTGEELAENDPLRDLLRLTVQGIAAGMRTTG
jgi:phosphoenolpyruvate carboxylase